MRKRQDTLSVCHPNRPPQPPPQNASTTWPALSVVPIVPIVVVFDAYLSLLSPLPPDGKQAMEISRCGLYCSQCKDFIYDRDFEGIHNGETIRSSELISMVQGKQQTFAQTILATMSLSSLLTRPFFLVICHSPLEPGQKRPRYAKWHAGAKEATAIKTGTKLMACQGMSHPCTPLTPILLRQRHGTDGYLLPSPIPWI